MKKRSDQEWQDLFAQQAASGLSARKFCDANKLCPKYFSLRKKQLTDDKPSLSAFVPVVIHPANASAKPASSPALVVRHGTSSLYFEATPNPAWLAQLLRALA